jgi:hypothetical protein
MAEPKDISDKNKIRETPEKNLISRKLIQLPFMVKTNLLDGLFEAVKVLIRMLHNPLVPSNTGKNQFDIHDFSLYIKKRI